MPFFMTRYAQFVSMATSALEIEEIAAGSGKFLDALTLVCSENKVGPAINEASDPVADQVKEYVAYVYHGGPKPRWVELSEL